MGGSALTHTDCCDPAGDAVGEGTFLLLALNFNAGRPRWVHDQLAVLPLRNNSKRPKLENTQEKASALSTP